MPAWVGLLALLEEFVWTHDDPRGVPKRRGDPSYERWAYRCAAPGCTARRNLEEHHIVYGNGRRDNSPSNRVTLCRGHHQFGVHGPFARIRGKAPLDIIWRLGTPELATWYRNERRIEPPVTD